MRSRTTAALTTGALAAALVLPAATATAAPGDLQISELRIDQSGDDDDEFFELSGPAGASLDGISYVVIGDSAAGSGVIEEVTDLTGLSLGSNGSFLVAESSFTLGGVTPDLVTSLSFENGDDVTHLLVEGLTGANGDDLDTDDDGTLDVLPWTGVVDAIGLVSPDDDGQVYGASLGFVDVGPAGPFVPASVQRDSDGILQIIGFFDLDDNTPLPGREGEPEVCEEPDTPISAVQGDGDETPLPVAFTSTGGFTTEPVTIEGVVTFADEDLEAFFVQEEAGDEDGDPTTSEAIYVFDRRPLPAVGTTVQLTDRVSERFGSTQMAFPTIEVCNVPPTEITPTELTLPLGDAARESLEHMLVKTTQDLEVTGLFGQFGEIGLTLKEAPLPVPTSLFAPDDTEAQALFDEQAASYLKLDDRNEGAFSRFPWGLANDGIGVRPGDVIEAGVTGPLDFTFGEYKIQPLAFPEIVEQGDNPRPASPELIGGNDIAAFNVLNYFNSFGNTTALRGATNANDFALQTAKIVAAINTLDAAVLGLVEVENDYGDLYDDDPATEASIVTLVEALNADAGFAKWDFVAPGDDVLVDKILTDGRDLGNDEVARRGLGTDAIAVGLIYQPERATPTGIPATFDIDAELQGLDGPDDTNRFGEDGDGPDADNNRWPLAQTFQVEGPGPDVTVVVNHFKSKGSPCDDVAGPGFDFGDDAGSDLLGNCDLTRQYAAEQLLTWLESRPTGVDHDRALVTGDLNAYDEERPISLFEEAGWTDLVEELGDDAFSYKFDGRYGRLDHALASPDLRKFVREAAVWQANSLEYYNNLYDVAPVDDTAYASSDHDPVVISLDAPGRSKSDTGKGRGPRR